MLSDNSFVRRVENGRLVWYKRAADAAFWDEHWATQISNELYEKAEQGELGYFEDIFTEYLPTEGRILEAGCGSAYYVLALRQRGYDIEGIDWAEKTIKQVVSIRPDLPVTVGDVTCLAIPDHWYSAYISLGVVEHLFDGPLPVLAEAWRVLKPGGVALISVPNFNVLRRIKAFLGLYGGIPQELEFYQYAFRESEFDAFLCKSGFLVLRHFHYSGFKCINDELPVLQKLTKVPVLWKLVDMFYKATWLDEKFGHMTMAICRKR